MEDSVQERLNRETLAEQVSRRLLDWIVTQGLRPGDRLPSEFQLAARFGVSRPVVRESLRSLSALSMIEIANGRGAVVRPVTPDLLGTFFRWAVNFKAASFIELHELRKGVEAESAALAATRRTEGESAELTRIVESMRNRLHDLDAYTELDLGLHLRIAAATRNILIRHLVESIRDPMKQVIRGGLDLVADDAELERMQARHEEIVAAIRKSDPKAARRAMEAHLEGAVARFVAAGAARLEGDGDGKQPRKRRERTRRSGQ